MPMSRSAGLAGVGLSLRAHLLVLAAVPLSAAVVGQNTAALPLTAARIASLPRRQRPSWKAYLERSIRQMQADRLALQAELNRAGMSEPLTPPGAPSARTMPLNRPPEWYGTPEARHVADIIVSFQTPAGGWSKNLNLADHLRRLGESFAPNNLSRFLGAGDFDAPHDPHWNYVGTLDNDATTTELQFLVRVIAALDAGESASYRTAFTRGLEYLFAAQFPVGGWPQVWPLEGGYHDAITYNDGAVTETLQLLQAVASGSGNFAFVPSALRTRAHAAVARGLTCILATQIVENGRRTVWGQQHDPFTLQPVAGRNYEPPAQCSSESATLVRFLMDLPDPDPAVVTAVHAAVAWFRKTAIEGYVYQRGPDGARLAPSPAAKPIWARYYKIGTGRPIFGDRDKTIHDTVEELSRERRNGYSWYNYAPQEVLDQYAAWSQSHPSRD